jgi:hypothetical protein
LIFPEHRHPLFTLPLWVNQFKGAYASDWGGLMAATSLAVVPFLIIFYRSAPDRRTNSVVAIQDVVDIADSKAAEKGGVPFVDCSGQRAGVGSAPVIQ